MAKYPVTGIPMATVDELSWLAGNWYGERGDACVEEQWATPAGNAMMGMFRWLQDDEVRFYEFMTIEHGAEGVVFRIKHFNPDLTGWEEQEVSVTFTLVHLDADGAIFVKQDAADPLWMVYRKIDEDTMIAYFEGESEPSRPEDQFRYTRRPSR